MSKKIIGEAGSVEMKIQPEKLKEVMTELKKIDDDFQAELKKTRENFNRVRELYYNIPNLAEKYRKNSFTVEECKIVDEYEELIFSEVVLHSKRQDKIRELQKRINDEDLARMFDERFSYMKQGVASNEVVKITTSKQSKKFSPILDNFTGVATVTNNEFTLFFENFLKSVGLRNSTHKLLDALLMKFAEGNNNKQIIEISLEEYMKMRGITDETKARKQVKEDLDALASMTANFTEKVNGKKKDFVRLKFIGTHGIKKGVIFATLDLAFHALLVKYPVMPMPRIFLALKDNHNPNAYHLGRRIALHKRMNYGKSNADIISVFTLLDACPNLADYEEIYKKQKSSYKEKIIEPFERDMDALEETGVFSWRYCHSNGLPLSDKELEKLNYEVFKNLLVKITWSFYPERAIEENENTSKRKKNKKKEKK